MNKLRIELIPRREWLTSRINQCLFAIKINEETENWEQFIYKCNKFAKELLYATEEWEKCYKDEV